MDAGMARARRERPHVADEVPESLGGEPLADDRDPRVHLIRWTDLTTLRSGYGNAAHRESNRFIPRGLRLEPPHTAVRRLSKGSD
jgi:hypothetical protein